MRTRHRLPALRTAACIAAAVMIASPALARSIDYGAVATNAEGPIPYEQQMAQREAALVLTQPVSGVENDYWFDYLTDIGEARHELTKDLKHASDSEDLRDAWDEYRHELADARHDYLKEMREKGYPVGVVRVVD